jgi:hypothetical protein
MFFLSLRMETLPQKSLFWIIFPYHMARSCHIARFSEAYPTVDCEFMISTYTASWTCKGNTGGALPAFPRPQRYPLTW